MIEAPYYPIIYIRGYAGTQGLVEDTVSTPYMGFNLGSTRDRQLHTGQVQPYVFESPVIRLMKDHNYVDAYREGQILPQGPIPSRSIWIFRYYDTTDQNFGSGDRPEIEFHAENLGEFLRHVRQAVLEENESPEVFRAYLVAHSMGGLICRCYLQNPNIPDLVDNPNLNDNPNLDGETSADWLKKGVDKLFTYGTPHGGIEFRESLSWVDVLRDYINPNNAGNFGPGRMREYLALDEKVQLNSLNNCFPKQRVFCVVGTNSRDYGAVAGFSRRAVGESSDGLVKIRNASVLGAPRAFVYRSHSGYYGLVNSESGYQNLRRFLFGDTRVLIDMEPNQVTLPRRVERDQRSGKTVQASYHSDTVFSVRGVPVELNRRMYDEASAIFRNGEDLIGKPTRLFTAFLMQNARVNRRRRSLGFAVRLQVRVPDYEVDHRWYLDDHYEAGILFSDKLNVEVLPRTDGISRLRYGWDSVTPNGSPHLLQLDARGENELVGIIPFSSRRNARPSISGNIRLTITPWNVATSA